MDSLKSIVEDLLLRAGIEHEKHEDSEAVAVLIDLAARLIALTGMGYTLVWCPSSIREDFEGRVLRASPFGRRNA